MRKLNRLKNRIIPILAVIIAVATVYTLILPALTMDNRDKVYCGCVEHEHSKSCYKRTDEIRKLVCMLTEGEDHTHTDDCYVIETALFGDGLTCEIPESENHRHDKMCYGIWELACGYKNQMLAV